jgi:Rrf2 family protein
VKLTFTSAYAVRALVHLAHSKTNAFIPSHVIAAAEDISEHFLLTLLRRLVSARILHGVRGRRGGYRLARPADRITLLEVINVVDGPLQGVAPEVARGKLHEQLQQVCDRSAELVRQRLRQVTVRDLASKGR